MLDWNDENGVWIQRLYACYSKNEVISPEALITWFIDYLNYPFIVEENHKTVICVPNDYVDMKSYPFQIVSFCAPDARVGEILRFSEKTELFCLHHAYRFTFVIDFSWSGLCSSVDGTCYINGTLKTIGQLLYLLSEPNSYSFPGTGYVMSDVKSFLSVIVVVPNAQCYTVMSGWAINAKDIPSKMALISRSVVKLERKFLQDIKNSQDHSSPTCKGHVSLSDLLRHGTLSVSLLNPSSAPATILFFTDGCFSTSDFEVPELVLSHLNSERVRCVFVLLADDVTAHTGSSYIQNSLFKRSSFLSAGIQQVELCSLVAKNTDGFVMAVPLESNYALIQEGVQNELIESLLAIPIIHHREFATDSNFNCSSRVMVKASSKLIELPAHTVLMTRLKSGFRLKAVTLSTKSVVSKSRMVGKEKGSFCSSSEQVDVCVPITEKERASIDCSVTKIKLDLEMVWGVNITFHCSISGGWIQFLHPFLVRGTTEFPTKNRDDISSLCCSGSRNSSEKSWVELKIEANYSFLQEFVSRHTLLHSTFGLSSKFSCLPLPVQMTALNDLLLVHVHEFNRNSVVRQVPNAFTSRLYPVFFVKNNPQGDLSAAPTLSDKQPLNSPDWLSLQRFIDYWRLFIDVDLLQCYRWMSLHFIFLLLEHDSLPSNLHFPLSGKRETSPLSCRQALFRVHALLSQWSSFVLLENSTYVKLFHIGDFVVEQLVHQPNSLSSVSPVRLSTQESIDSTKVGECDTSSDKTCSGVSVSTVSHFCVIRLELKIPEVKFCIGFVNDTPVDIQREIIDYLKVQLTLLRFPPRGRQAIPKSRHKSGTFQHMTEFKHVPPLQRSWEDTPCCTIFRTRLDRLAMDSGTFCNQVVMTTGYASIYKNNSVNVPPIQDYERLSKIPKQNRFPFLRSSVMTHPTISSILLAQHLHHSICVWAMFSATSKSCIQSIFSSLLNIRLQEGFHVARVGPEPGFVSLFTEIEMQQALVPLVKTPCLVQYQVYPVVDPRNVGFQAQDLGHLTVINSSLKARVDALASEVPNSLGANSVKDMEKSVLSPIIIVTEIWIQPVVGTINSLHLEADHWSGCTFIDLPLAIFNEDKECIVPYTTLDSLYNLVMNMSNIYIASHERATQVGDDMHPSSWLPADVRLAYSRIPRLLSLCPNLIILLPLLGHIVNKNSSSSRLNSLHNESLMSSLHSRLLKSGLLVEVPVSMTELKSILSQWGHNMGNERGRNSDVDLPNLRCFIGQGSLKQSTDSNVFDEPNPMVTIILVPSSLKDAFHPVLFNVISSRLKSSLEVYQPSLPYLPVFVYVCSRVYISYLIDDRWTYKTPDTHIIDMRSDGQHLLRSDKHECSNASKLNFLSGAVPDCFLNVGCQNHRLTQELRTLWSDLMFSYKLLKHSHSYAYSVSIQGIIESNSDADIGDVNYVLRHSEDFFPMPPLSLDITSFVLLTCSHLFTYLHLIHQKSNNYEQGSANPRFLPVLGRGEPKQVLPPLRILDSKNLLIKFCVSSEDSDCCEVQKNCLYNTFCEYLTPIPKLDGVYLLSKSRLMDRNNHSFRRRVGRESYSKTTGMVDATEIRNHTVTSNGCTVSVPSKLFSEASGESEAAWDSQTLKSQKVASFDRNHSTSQPPDLLVRKLVEWFYLASKNSSDVCPLFLRIRGILKYKEMSSIVPLSNGIPVFCAARFREILSQLVLKSTSQHDLPSQSESPATNKKSTLTIDLGQLNFYVEVLPIGSPYCGLSIPQNIHDTYVHRKPYNKRNRENHTESFTSRIQNPDVESSEASPGPSVFINIAYSTMEEECVAIDGWLGQHNISKIPSSQQCFLRLFIFQMLWYLHDRSVNCLRSLGPVTEKSLETILQHIEDTCKAMQTPLFNPCNILLNHSYISSSEDELLKSNSQLEKLSTMFEQQCTIAPNFCDIRKQVLMQRIRLDFVLYDTDVVDQFTKYFESMLVSQSYGYPHYVNGYYYLSKFNGTYGCISERRCMNNNYEEAEKSDYIPVSGNYKFGMQASNVTMAKHFSFHSFSSGNMPTTFTSPSETLVKSRKGRCYDYQSVSNRINRWFVKRKKSPSDPSRRNTSQFRRSYSISTVESGYSKAFSEAFYRNKHIRRSASLCRVNNFEKDMDSPLLRERTQSANEFLPFWFIFRICSNSVSVFFHHTDSHIRSNHSPDAAISTSLASEKTMYQVSSDKLSLECEYCNIYHNVVNSIHSVIRILNQKLLLAKLCDERLCDELLLPVDEADMISKPDLIYINECSESNIRNGSLDLINSCGWKIRSKRRIRPFMRHTLITDKKKVTVSDQKLKTCSNTSSNGVGKSNCTKLSTAYDTTKHPVNLSCDQLKVLTQHENWPPGVFACPVQMTSYIRLHPRVFLNSQMYPVEKGRRIIPALRQLLENLAITNRPNMFFLIDHPSKPDSNSIATRRKKHTYCDSEVRSGHSIAEYSQQPIFYMLLKEVTTSAFLSERQPSPSDKQIAQMEPKYPLESRFNGKTDKTIHVCSDVSTSTYFGSSEQTTKGIHRGIRLTSTSKMNYGNNSHIGESYLQITLHGISPPSRNLCASVHHMLQTRLDALVLQHISDSLSRNAINRLSMEDFLFLLNRRPEQPHLHFFISLPKFFTDNDQSLFGITVPYKPNQTVLAFCHYFRQNLLLFLTPVKLDRDTKTLLKGLGKAELFLFNRPSAQGFSKHGVATVLVQLMMVSGDKTLQMNHNPLEPYVILDWASPNEPIWTSKSCDLCCQDISNAIKDFSEVSEFDMQTHPGLIQPLPRLVLSVRMWEREHSDLSKLKLRLMNSVHHALYDLMTEYLVLTLPIFFDFDCSGVAHQDLKTTDFVTSDSRSKCVNAEDLSLNNIIFPWMKEGRNIESPLVTNVSASLSSSLFVEQLISDLLKPFISHEDVSVFDISPNASCRKTNCATEFTSVSKISCGSYSSLETPGNSCLKYDAIFGESAHMFRPGFTSEYIIVGHNLNAWRNTRGLSHTGREYKPSTFHKSSGSLSKIRLIEFISDSGNHYDASSRMQPLRVNISSNQYSSSSVSNDFNPNFKRIHRNEEISTSEARFSSGNDGRRRTVQSSDSHWCPADNCYCYGSLVSKFPEFCPVKIGMIRQIIRHPSAEASISTNLSQNDRSNSNECLNKNSLITREKCKMNVHIPRQSFCLISIDGRQIHMFTYNWTKEEAERLSYRLLLSVDWYNQRYQLLCSLSFQKLGLFHAINNPSFRECATRAMDLIRNTCPPELNIGPDSTCTVVGQTPNNLHSPSTLSSVASTLTAQTAVSGGSMNILSAVVSVARRRHATSSIPDVTASSSSSNNFCNPSHINSELKENKNINNFLRLFQDCGRIPPLTAAANPHFPHVDILHRYGKQASTLIEADVLRSQYIEMFSLPFRAWQEGSKCCTANKESDPTKSLLLNNDTGQKFPHPNSSIASSETTLVNEQLSKRLQRYSAIKQACRHLHTISTPILFCPKTRSKIVQLMKEEENAMKRTAQLYFSTTVSHSANSSSSSCSSTTTDTTFKTTTSVASTNSVVANSTVSKEDDFSDKLHHHTKNIIEHSSLSSHNRNPTRDPNTTINLIPSSKPNCLKPKQMADTNVGGDRFLSPWLSWSHNAATSSNLDDVGPLSSDTLLTDNNSRNEKSQHNDGHTSVVNFNNWLRRVARQFLVKYSQYLQQEVGFHPIPILNTSVTPNRRDQTVKPNVNYALFHRSIHLAGLHIIELFIRNSRLFVRVGTIEVSRFSWHASRSVTMGPYTSEVISQAAASAAASMTSVMFNAVFRRNMKKFVRSPNLSNVDSPFSDVSALSDPNCSDWMQYSNNLSWNESSKLCDYTHLHSFAYDFHLHAIQDYLGNRRCCHRGQCSDASRRSSSSVKNGYSNVIDIPDYPVTKFLEDLSCLAQKIPLFSRGYLCCFPVTCHVSLCLRPDQVFHHLIEEHASYGVDIVRMSRSECSIAQTNPPYNKHLSYNFALVEQCHPGQESSFRSSSEHQPKYQPSSNFRTFSESHSISTGSKEQSSKYSALGIANAHHIVEDLTKLDRNFSHSHSLPQPYSVTGIVVPDEINGTYSDIRSPIDGSITNRLLHLIVYLIVLDSKHEFPEFRLAKLNSGSCIQCPVDWPAVPPCLDPCSFSHQLHSFHRSPKSFGIEDTDISSLIAEPFFQNFSIPLTTNNSDQKISKHSENTSENDIRWHMSYLSMCPSHQVQLLRVLRISQSILESRITQLIARSGVDCHKNLLWYKLFDTNSSLATQILSTSGQSLSQNTVDSNCQMEKTPSINLGANSNPVDSYVCPVLNHQSLSMREIEELVDSAPFQLDILRLDPRLHELFKVGACHLNTISVLLNREFVNSQQNSHHQTDQMKMNTNPKLYKCSTSETISCIAYRFSHSIEDKMDNGSDGHGECRQCLKNYMVLLSPSFTEGLIFLSWCETSDNCVPSEGSTVHTASGSSTVIKSGHIDDRRGNKDNSATTLSDTTRITMAWNTKKYKDFQFRAVFRAVGDPTNPSSMRRLVDSDIEIQNLFFKTSTLALVATNLIEKLSVLVWRTLHN